MHREDIFDSFSRLQKGSRGIRFNFRREVRIRLKFGLGRGPGEAS